MVRPTQSRPNISALATLSRSWSEHGGTEMKGNLTRRGKTSWRLKFDTGRDPVTGRRITKFVTLRGTRRQAQEEAAKIIAGTATGEYVERSKTMVADYLRS